MLFLSDLLFTHILPLLHTEPQAISHCRTIR